MENYICLNLQVPEWEQESWVYYLTEIGCEGFEQQENLLKAYFKEINFHALSIKKVLGNTLYYFEKVENINWNAEWENNFPMVVLEGICEIYASHHTPSFNQPYSMFIQPQMSFGTGHHITTQLMIKLINDWDCSDKSLLDMGAGTGILGIFALIKKAKEVTFIDIEDVAVENIQNNIRLNNLPNQKIIQGDHLSIKEIYDGIFANINRNVLLLHAQTYYEHLKSKGSLFLSGFFNYDAPKIIDIYHSIGFEPVKNIKNNR